MRAAERRGKIFPDCRDPRRNDGPVGWMPAQRRRAVSWTSVRMAPRPAPVSAPGMRDRPDDRRITNARGSPRLIPRHRDGPRAGHSFRVNEIQSLCPHSSQEEPYRVRTLRIANGDEFHVTETRPFLRPRKIPSSIREGSVVRPFPIPNRVDRNARPVGPPMGSVIRIRPFGRRALHDQAHVRNREHSMRGHGSEDMLRRSIVYLHSQNPSTSSRISN